MGGLGGGGGAGTVSRRSDIDCSSVDCHGFNLAPWFLGGNEGLGALWTLNMVPSLSRVLMSGLRV